MTTVLFCFNPHLEKHTKGQKLEISRRKEGSFGGGGDRMKWIIGQTGGVRVMGG